MKSILLAAAIGAGLGLAMIAWGFNFRLSPTVWIGGTAAYLPAAIAGAVIAGIAMYAWQRGWRA